MNDRPAPLLRREILQGAMLGAGVALAAGVNAQEGASTGPRPGLIDVNVNLFSWPFRKLPCDTFDQLTSKLRALHIHEAWAGSFEGLLHRDLVGVNTRLAEQCRLLQQVRFTPFGSVNPELPDWEEDLRQCQETHHMPGIRLHPNYHGYDLNSPRFARLLKIAAERKLLVQLAVAMEDTRTQHPLIQVADVDLSPLPKLLEQTPQAQVVLLNFRPRGDAFSRLVKLPNVTFDVARVDATDGVRKLLSAAPLQRVLLGTHAPFLIPEASLIRIDESDLTPEEIAAVGWKNAKRLLATR